MAIPAEESGADDDPVPISALQHYLFCPRQCALIHVERAWAENALTAEGRIAHETVHAPKSERRRGVRTVTAMPLRYGDDPLLWAAWLYYEEGLTQSDIAEKMGLSRASVNAYLADARTRGIVNIEIAPAKFRALSIARALRDRSR